MNIIITDNNGAVGCRPDTSWERENKDLYSPDFVTGYHWAPVFFARVCKAGKCVGAKFATRYYDAVNYGLLLYPEIQAETLLPNRLDGNRLCSIMDRTTFLPFPMYNRVVLENGDNVFELKVNGSVVYSTGCGTEAMIEKAIVDASRLMSLRIGDLLCVELQGPAPLLGEYGLRAHPSSGNHLTATFCGNFLFDFLIK